MYVLYITLHKILQLLLEMQLFFLLLEPCSDCSAPGRPAANQERNGLGDVGPRDSDCLLRHRAELAGASAEGPDGSFVAREVSDLVILLPRVWWDQEASAATKEVRHNNHDNYIV